MEELSFLEQLFTSNRNNENATPMAKYMKNQFPFLGIKTPLRRQLMREFFKETGVLKQDFKPDLVLQLWNKEDREYQYAALDYMNRSLKKLNANHIPLLETLITTKSWWDTVDIIASKPVGHIMNEEWDKVANTMESWANSDHMWLNRTAILFQLKYKENTNEDLLYRYILLHAESKEFFLQKAIGWALREYSKTNRESVKQFISNHTLSKLSIREGSKYI